MEKQIIPTRMELLKVKGKIELSKKGYDLLKQKRDALLLEFFKILKKSRDLRSELNEKMKEAYSALALAHLYHQAFVFESIALGCAVDVPVGIEVKNIMGVHIPTITKEREFSNEPLRYSIIGTSAKIDRAVRRFRKVCDLAIGLAENETAMKRLIREIEKTKRRVNALEYNVIPALEKQKREIMTRLDEIERDSFVSLKIMKKNLGKKKDETGLY